ncbi:MAG: hypothetical protein ABI811_20260 [Acidobacteriota bacterium]
MDQLQILTIALATAPTMITVLIGILINNGRMSDLNARLCDMNARIGEMAARIDQRFNDVDRHFDDMRDMWRSELHRWKKFSTPA